jgi:hypothetical protein
VPEVPEDLPKVCVEQLEQNLFLITHLLLAAVAAAVIMLTFRATREPLVVEHLVMVQVAVRVRHCLAASTVTTEHMVKLTAAAVVVVLVLLEVLEPHQMVVLAEMVFNGWTATIMPVAAVVVTTLAPAQMPVVLVVADMVHTVPIIRLVELRVTEQQTPVAVAVEQTDILEAQMQSKAVMAALG